MAIPAEVKKVSDNRIAVRWVGSRHWQIIEDPIVAEYLVFWILKGADHQSGMIRAV